MRDYIGDPPRRRAVGPWIVLLIMMLGASTVFAQQPAATREINGVVLDVDGQPVANATVTVAGAAGVAATTGADGTFKLAKAPVTNVTIDVAAQGFAARQIAVLGARTPLQLQVVVVRPAAPAPPATRSIGGVVTDGKRAPIAGATVRVRGTELVATTAADGTFTIAGVAAGEVTIDVEAPGQPPVGRAVPADRAAVVVAIGEASPEAPQPPPPAARTIRGRVVDPVSGEGIPAAQVTVKGTGALIITEADGSFVIENAPAGVVLLDLEGPERAPRQFEIPAGTDTPTIPLAQLEGEQIVIEGRAPVIVKQNLANGASVVDSDDLTRVSAAEIDSALQGKLAGSNLQFNSGAPGGGAQLRLRGISTINGQSSPLYVIDGVIVSNVAIPPGTNAITAAAAGGSASVQDNPVNRIADLNPNDIETVEVLKGASAAALYGSKAANGVVVITTKRGRQGENRVDVTQRIGFAALSNKLPTRTFGSMDEVMEAFPNNPTIAQAFMDANGQTFDHQDAITRTTFQRETIASASGGTENGNYYGSVLVRDEPGVVQGSFYEKQTGRIAIGYKLGDRVRVGLTANVIHSTSDRGLTNNDNAGTSLYVVLAGTPSFVDLRSRGGLYPINPAVGGGANPLQTVALFENREDVWRVISGGTAAFDAYKSGDGVSQLRLLANVGVDSFDQKNNILSPSQLTFEPADNLVGTSIDGTTTNLNFNIGTGLLHTYTPKHGRWRNALSGGVTYESVDLSSVYVTARNLTAGQPNVDSGSTVAIAQTRLRTKESGLYLQDEVALLNDRLSLLGGLLGERSSVNGDTGKYFVYPKLAAVYSLLPPTKDGLEGSPLARFEVLRVRGAYGEAGNRPNYGNKFTALNATTNIDGNAGIVLGGIAGDPEIEPERQREFEIGTDAALKDQKLVAELTFYRRDISNLILQRALATSTGFTTEFINGGSMRNLGVELALQVTPVSKKGLEWTTRGTLTLNRSTITDLPVPAFNNPGTGFGGGLGVFRLQEGRSATQIVGAADKDGDGEGDVVGNGEPDFRIGWSNIITAGNFTFTTLVDWQQGSDIINLTRFLYDFAQNSPDVEAAAERFATADGGDISPYVEDATFVKVREISVAYTLPKRLAAQIGPVKTLTLSASGRNLLTFTNYSGLDPEVSNFGNQPIGRNYDVAPYPPSRSFWFSVSAGL